jgi:hypothetical protein
VDCAEIALLQYFIVNLCYHNVLRYFLSFVCSLLACLFLSFFLCILDYVLVNATDIMSSEVGRCHNGDLKDWFVLGYDPVGANFPRNSLYLSAE